MRPERPTQNHPSRPALNVIPFQQYQQQQQQWGQQQLQQQQNQQQPTTQFATAPPAQQPQQNVFGATRFLGGFGASAASIPPARPGVFGATQSFTGFGGSAATVQPAQQGLFGAAQSSSGFGAPAVSAAEVPVDPALIEEHVQHELSKAKAYSLQVPEDDDFEDLEGPCAITEPTTVVSETPMAISFSVHGESTIPSDGVEHQVSVAVLPFQAKISYIAIPRIDPRVFLQVNL